MLWHGSDGLDGTVPRRPKGPDSGAEVSLGVVRCHLGGPEGGTRYCGWAKPPHFFRGAGIAPGGPGRLGHETRQGSNIQITQLAAARGSSGQRIRVTP